MIRIILAAVAGCSFCLEVLRGLRFQPLAEDAELFGKVVSVCIGRDALCSCEGVCVCVSQLYAWLPRLVGAAL